MNLDDPRVNPPIEDKRFEAALRIFVALIEENLSRPLVDLDATMVERLALGAVSSADQLLAQLRKERP